jgi:hypothetical protein
MGKVPVVATIAHAYRFTLNNFLALVGLLWLPMLLAMAAIYFLNTQFRALMDALVSNNTAAIGSLLLFIAIPYVAASLLLFMQVVSATSLALGLHTGPSFISFSLGKPLWRLIGKVLLAFLIFLLLAAIMVVIGSVVAGIAFGVAGADKNVQSGGGTAIIAGLLVVVIAYAIPTFVLLRQTFFLAPVVLAEDRSGLGRAWNLSEGNFWRIFVVVLALTVPIYVVDLIFFGIAVPSYFTAIQPGVPQAEKLQRSIEMLNQMQARWYLVYPFFAFITTAFWGLLCGAQAFAYRSLVPAEKAEDVF